MMLVSVLSSLLRNTATNIANYFISWLTPFWITLYLALAIIGPVLIIYTKRNLIGTTELNVRYHSFARFDYPHWSYWKMPLLNILTLFPVRLFLNVSIKVFYVLISQLAMIGSKSDEPLAKWRVGIMALVRFFLSRLHWMMCGITSIKKVLPPVNYSKYLGPEWTPTYTKSGIQVANHTSWLDVVACMFLDCPSFVAKFEVSKIPVIAGVANSL